LPEEIRCWRRRGGVTVGPIFRSYNPAVSLTVANSAIFVTTGEEQHGNRMKLLTANDDSRRRSYVRSAAVQKSVSPCVAAWAAPSCRLPGSHRSSEREGRASAVPAAWTVHSRVAQNIGTSWRSYPGSVQRPAPPRACSSLRQIQTVEPLRTSPLQTSSAGPPNQSPERFSPKVAGFYSATCDRVMPPLHGLLLLRRVQPELLAYVACVGTFATEIEEEPLQCRAR